MLNEGGDMADIKELKKQVIFEDISDAELEKLAKVMKEINNVTPYGWKQTLAVLTPGHFFGELSIIEHRRHEANAIAIESAELLKLPKEEFEKLEKEDVVLASQILKKLVLVMSKNLRRMNEKFLNALINY